MQIETTDVTTIGQLSDPEVDELLERAINPRMPIEVFYAVLDRIGGIPAAAAPAAVDAAVAVPEVVAAAEAAAAGAAMAEAEL